MPSSAPIGIFDSGVGGLSVLRAIHAALPAEDLIYIADQANLPYGGRPASELIAFSERITSYLLQRGCKLIVVACNTASGAALYPLRQRWPQVPFVGMEPAIKPAAAATQTGVVGVLATRGTLTGQLYENVKARHASSVTVLEVAAHGLVAAVEANTLNQPAIRTQLAAELAPLLAAGVDQLVLGCTHFPFAASLITDLVGPSVTLIDPAPAIARQVERLLTRHDLHTPAPPTGNLTFHTTGDLTHFAHQLTTLLHIPTPPSTPIPSTYKLSSGLLPKCYHYG